MNRGLNRVLLFFSQNSILIVFIVLSAVMGFLSDKFFTLQNWLNILNNYSVIGIVALAVSVVLIAGGIDLSFPSILACTAVLATFLMPHALVVPLVLTVPLITTLGTQWLYLAVLLLITGGALVQGNTDNLFTLIGNGKIAGVPFPIYLLFAMTLLTWFVLRRTAFGKFVYAHGSKRDALYASGINADRVYLFSFVFMGALIGVGGVLLSSRLIGVRPTEGGRYLINILTAVILSGVSLNGGIGSPVNVFIAVVVLGVIDNAMVLLGVQYKDQQIIRGVVFILAIIYNNFMVKRSDLLLRRMYRTEAGV
jgi:ribose transport system permease protein